MIELVPYKSKRIYNFHFYYLINILDFKTIYMKNKNFIYHLKIIYKHKNCINNI